MRFAYPEIRYLLVLVPIVLALFVSTARWRSRTQAALGDASLVRRLSATSPKAWRIGRRAGLLAALVLLTFAAARPLVSLDWVNVEGRGIDLVVALDVSESMAAEDVKPSRIARARQDIKDVLTQLSGDRVALVFFSGEAVVQTPLTLDTGALRMFVDAAEPGMLPRPGTALDVALTKSLECFEAEDRSAARAILIITDGESHEGDLDRAIARVRQSGVRVFALGVGSVAGEPIPVRDASGTVTLKTDREGRVVMTRLDEAALGRVAMETGGAYIPAGGGGSDVTHLASLIGDLEEKAYEAGLFKLYEDRFVFFLAPAVALLALELLVGDLRGRRRA
jgi:Ca-activated chloride channel family protein